MMRMQANSCGQVLWYAELSPVACGVPVVVVFDQCDGMCACGIAGALGSRNPCMPALGTLACRLEGPAYRPGPSRTG